MNGIATMTVIRGTGACDVMINGVVQKEIARLNEEYEKKMRIMEAELQATKKHRNNLLADRLAELNKESKINNVKETVEAYWAMVWYFAEKWGLVVYEG